MFPLMELALWTEEQRAQYYLYSPLLKGFIPESSSAFFYTIISFSFIYSHQLEKDPIFFLICLLNSLFLKIAPERVLMWKIEVWWNYWDLHELMYDVKVGGARAARIPAVISVLWNHGWL